MGVKTYDAKEVSVIVGGRPLQGKAEDFLTMARNEDNWMLQVGADGESCRSRNNNKSGTYVVRLKASSDDNAYLSGLAAADDLGVGVTVDVLVKDTLGADLYVSAEAWVKKHPDAPFGKEKGDREWIIESNEVQMFAGGN